MGAAAIEELFYKMHLMQQKIDKVHAIATSFPTIYTADVAHRNITYAPEHASCQHFVVCWHLIRLPVHPCLAARDRDRASISGHDAAAGDGNLPDKC